MLRFLRQFRKNLFDGGKISRYLLYAIGEIVLVVIGILIALQINNWNTQLKEKEDLNGYLQNISNNIKSNQEQIASIIAFRDSVKLYSSRITELVNKEYIDPKDFLLIVDDNYNVFYDQYLEINQSGFEALKSSGYLGKIQNTTIEKLLNEYYLLVNRISKQETSLNNFIENMEVLGFETNTFPRMISIFENPEIDKYFKENQKEIRSILNNPSIMGANFRGSIVSGLMNDYKALLSLGNEIIREVQIILKESN